MLENLGKGWNLLVEDESIFIYDSVLSRKKKWIIREKNPQSQSPALMIKHLCTERSLWMVNSYSDRMKDLTVDLCRLSRPGKKEIQEIYHIF